MSKPDKSDVYKAILDASLPLSWFNFKRLVGSGDIHLNGPEKPLASWLLFAYIVCTVTFVGQLVYYSSLTTTDFVVSQEYNLTGHVCRPLQKDPEYGLFITHDECMATYEPVSNEDLTVLGTFDPTGIAVDPLTSAYVPNHNGPWNFTSRFGYESLSHQPRSPLWDGITIALYNHPTTYFHKPFPEISQQAYTHHPTCIIPAYPGFENTSIYQELKGSVMESSLLFAFVNAAFTNGKAYGPQALCNKNPGELGIQPFAGGGHFLQDHNFHPAGGTDFVSQCSGTFTPEMQTDLYTNGGYVAPLVYATSSSFFSCMNADQCRVVKSTDRTVGMTPMYPKSHWVSESYWDQHNLPPMSEGTFFGIPRCDFYERQMSKEAYEFVYSHENCHPCDGFKFNTPFHCEKQVRKTAGEIIGLSVSNTLALFGFLITVGPALVRALKIQEDAEVSKDEKHELPAIQ